MGDTAHYGDSTRPPSLVAPAHTDGGVTKPNRKKKTEVNRSKIRDKTKYGCAMVLPKLGPGMRPGPAPGG